MIRVEFETSVAGVSTVSHGANPVQNRLDVERVVSDFYAPLYRFALALTHSETEAADLTQETFLILSKQRSTDTRGRKNQVLAIHHSAQRISKGTTCKGFASGSRAQTGTRRAFNCRFDRAANARF
jgi:hypothetical protein